jgi:hypothetical protein
MGPPRKLKHHRIRDSSAGKSLIRKEEADSVQLLDGLVY